MSELALPLSVEFSSPSLLDQKYCTSVAKMLTGAGVRWSIRRATPSLQSFLPRLPGLYMFVWRPWLRFLASDGNAKSFPVILYVGQTGGEGSANTIRSRYTEYARLIPSKGTEVPQAAQSLRAERLARYLGLSELEFWYATPDDATLIPELENRIINLMTPPLNHQRPKVRPRRIVAAF